MKTNAVVVPSQATVAEDALRRVVDTTPALIHTGRSDGHLDYFNKGWLDFLGKSLDDVCGWRWTDLIHPEDVAGIVQKWHAALAGGEPFEAEARVRCADGTYRTLLHRKVPLRDEHGNIVKWFGSSIEIEDRKRGEALFAGEKRLLEMIATGVAVHEILNALCLIIEEYRPGTLASILLLRSDGLHLDSVAGPSLPKAWREEMDRLPIGPCAGSCGTAAYRGSPVIVSDIATDPLWEVPEHRAAALSHGLRASWSNPILSSDGKVLGTFCMYGRETQSPTAQDLGLMEKATHLARVAIERDRAEAAVRTSEAYLVEAQRLSHTGSFGCKFSSGEMFWSEETFGIFGYNLATTPAVEAILHRVHPEDKARVQEQVHLAASEGKACDLEYRLLMPDDSVKHVHVVAHAAKDEPGGFEFVGAVIDTTERKRAEEKIREHETELRQILELAPQHVMVFGPDGSPVYTNRVALEYYGVGLEQFLTASRIIYVHPDDRERFLAVEEKGTVEEMPHEIEIRVLRHDGKFRWFLVRYTPLKDEQGRITRWFGTGTDIEDRKQAEEKLRYENAALREELGKTSMFEEMIGTSSALQMVLSRAAKVAPTDSTVLIMGETGTGKELIARAIHKRSKRSERSFITVNCGAIPPALIMSELFGHEKGAFTGALQRRSGKFELAEGGTIFLDEVGDLPSETQVALLRVLQEREFERVGGTQVLRADVRVIAATNRDLQAAIADGAFRSDLYYRINVFPITMPPLRERKEDVPLLVNYFVDRFAKRAGKKIKHIQKKALEVLQEYSWPGNVRELQNVIERSLIITDTNEFSIDKSWVANEPQPRTPALDQNLNERKRIEAALAQSGGRISGANGAAAQLGIPASTLESKIRALRINKFQFKGV